VLLISFRDFDSESRLPLAGLLRDSVTCVFLMDSSSRSDILSCCLLANSGKRQEVRSDLGYLIISVR